MDIYLPGGLIAGQGDLATARTAGFTVLVLAHLFNCFNARSETGSAFKHLFVNPWLWGAVALSGLLQVAVVHVPVLNIAFGTAPLNGDQWVVCAGMASTVLVYSELRKLLVRTWMATRNAYRKDQRNSHQLTAEQHTTTPAPIQGKS